MTTTPSMTREDAAVAMPPAPPSAPMPPHVRVGGIRIFDGNHEDALRFCHAAIERRCGARIATANLDFLALADRDPQLHADLEGSTLVVADGAPVAWLARLIGARRVARVAGVDLVTALCETATEVGGLRVAFYGGEPETAAAAARHIEDTCPGVKVVLQLSPPFRPMTADEQHEEQRRIAAARPDIVFVALGCPKQERRIAEYFEAAPEAVWIGVGGTFDFIAGRRRRAPRALQAAGLEWLVRLLQEPRRLAGRYLGRDLPMFLRLAGRCLRARFLGGPQPPEMGWTPLAAAAGEPPSDHNRYDTRSEAS